MKVWRSIALGPKKKTEWAMAMVMAKIQEGWQMRDDRRFANPDVGNDG